MGFVDVGTWQHSGAKLDFVRGTWQKLKQKHCLPVADTVRGVTVPHFLGVSIKNRGGSRMQHPSHANVPLIY